METLQRTANRGSISTGYDIDNSLKLEADNTEYLYKTNDTGTNRKTFTVSMWFKRTELTNDYMTLWLGADVAGATRLGFYGASGAQETLWVDLDGSSTYNRSYSTQVLRDTSAWYHVVLAVDTTQAVEANRMLVWLNGVNLTSWGQQQIPAQNFETSLGASGSVMKWGAYDNTYYKMCGYIAECHYLDGVTAQNSDFGEFDEDTGIWKPIKYTGTYGGNGCYLKFDDSSNLGADSSGNSNNFTLNNITAADQATDTPTNNGCTLNVLASLEGSNDITEGALVSTGKAGGGGNFNGTYGTMGIDPFNSSVDWYWEIQASSTTNGSSDDIGIGWIKESRITSGSTAYNNVYADGISRYSSQTATSAGDIWGVLLETGTTPVMKLYRNDGLIYTATHGSGGVSFDTLMFPYITVKGTGTDARLNFLNPASSFSIASGNTDPNGYGNFEFDPKGGYAICGKNLAEFGGTA